MARTSNRTDLPIKKQKPVKGVAGKVGKFSNDWLMPQSPADVAMLLFPYGKVAKGVGRAVKKVIKPASKTKKVTKLAEPKSAVRVKPTDNFVEAPIKDTKLGERSRVFVPRPVKARVPARKPANPARATVKINSARTVQVVKVKPRKKSAAQLRPKKK